MGRGAFFSSFTFDLRTKESKEALIFKQLHYWCFRFVMRDGKVVEVLELSSSGPWLVWQVQPLKSIFPFHQLAVGGLSFAVLICLVCLACAATIDCTEDW